MGNNRPVKTKDWLEFLKSKNCKYIRTKASHVHYRCPNCWRTITYREKDKEIPAFHLKTNLSTMGLTLDDLYKWIEENC
jgi:predicted RNA binding protein YcfA (HicA-like mRNA interferase family)